MTCTRENRKSFEASRGVFGHTKEHDKFIMLQWLLSPQLPFWAVDGVMFGRHHATLPPWQTFSWAFLHRFFRQWMLFGGQCINETASSTTDALTRRNFNLSGLMKTHFLPLSRNFFWQESWSHATHQLTVDKCQWKVCGSDHEAGKLMLIELVGQLPLQYNRNTFASEATRQIVRFLIVLPQKQKSMQLYV